MSNKIIRSSIKALIVSLITAAVLLFIFNYIALKSTDPDKLLPLFSIIILLISGLVGGITSGRQNPDRFILSPIIFSLLFILLHFILSIIFGQGKDQPLTTLFIYLGIIITSVLGSIIGVPKKAKKSKTLKHYKKMRKTK